MKWINRLEECIQYIEENLKDEIELNVLCEKACLSSMYFPRLFEAVTGIQLSEYIRRRRMTLAAKELSNTNRKVIDIALDYGYSSSESFSRAFKSVHGISPSYVRKHNHILKSYPKLVFTISIKGDSEMDYRIEEKKAFQLLGTSITTFNVEGENNTEIPAFWAKVNNDGTSEKLCNLASKPGAYGACFDSDTENKFKYTCGVSYDGGETGGFEVVNIPEAKWAIFESIGPLPHSLQKVWTRIFSEWLPATNYEIASSPQIEFYYVGDSNSPDYKCEVWIPLKK